MAHRPLLIVALLPGFLGFSSMGRFSYFSRRIDEELKRGLRHHPNIQVDVHSLDTLPTSGLNERQRRLIVDELLPLKHRYKTPDIEFHLLGHSVGGVDAQFLLYDRPLYRNSWAEIPGATALRRQIRSVISLSAPHHGSMLATDPLARFLIDPLQKQNRDQFIPFVRFLGKLYRSIKHELQEFDIDKDRIIWRVLKFAYQSLNNRSLIEDLTPSTMAALRQGRAIDSTLDVIHRSIVSVSAMASVSRSGLERTPDDFFKDLYRRTSGPVDPWVSLQPHVQAVRDAMTRRLIAHPRAKIPPIDARVNDGIANTARQVLDPHDPNEVAAVVIGDHADVLGIYHSETEPRSRLETGLLHSGSGFNDDTFRDLYHVITDIIAGASRWIDAPHPKAEV